MTDEWRTDTPYGPDPSWARMGLTKVLAAGESPTDQEHPYTTIGIRTSLPGLRTICGEVATNHGMSYSQFTRLALKHAVSLLAADERLLLVRDALGTLRTAAMDSGNSAALRRLDELHPFEFLESQERRTTYSCILKVTGFLADQARVCGIPQARLAVIALCISMLTLPNERKYRDLLDREVGHFWDVMNRREQALMV